MYRRHLESLRKKLTSRVALLRRLAGSGWGAGATTLRTANLALVRSTADYCAPVWCHSAHTRLINPAINYALRIITGCLRPTPADNLPVLAGIQPAELRRNGPTLSLALRAMEPGHLLHSALTRPSSANARRLKSRHPFVPAAQQLIGLSDRNNIREAQWADHQWNVEWVEIPTRFRIFIPDTGTHHPGMTLPLTEWVRLNRLRTSVGRFWSCLYKWAWLLLVQMGCDLWVWRRRTNGRQCCPPMSNPSTSSWTTGPDGSGRWDKRMAAQYLPLDLVRPSSGLKNPLKRWRRRFSFTFPQCSSFHVAASRVLPPRESGVSWTNFWKVAQFALTRFGSGVTRGSSQRAEGGPLVTVWVCNN